MNEIKVQPLKSVNNIKFGMKREEVRNLLGEAREFKKSIYSKNTTDDFGFCHVFYNTKDECEAVELFENNKVFIDGLLLFPTTIAEAKSMIHDFIEEEDSLISKSQSIGIYAPYGKMESILFGKENYYED